jgi:hypothetical protein
MLGAFLVLATLIAVIYAGILVLFLLSSPRAAARSRRRRSRTGSPPQSSVIPVYNGGGDRAKLRTSSPSTIPPTGSAPW